MRFSGKTATAIVPYPANRILLIKRSTPPFIDYWALPGGRSESGETVEHTIVREVKEETGLDVEVLIKVGEYHEKGIQAGLEYDYYPTCFVVKPIDGALKKQDSEISEIKLFGFNELPVLAFEHSVMVKDYIELERQKKSK